MITIVIFNWRGVLLAGFCSLLYCSIETMFHCPYLLHKSTCLTVFSVPRLFQLPTALLEYLDLLRGGAPAFQVAIPIWLWSWNMHTALLLLMNPIAPPAPLTFYHLKRRCFVTSYCMFNLLCSTMNQQLFIKRTFVIKVVTMKIKDDLMQAITCLDTFRGEWYTKEGCAKSMKNALYVQQYGKRHLSGWSNVKHRKKSHL